MDEDVRVEKSITGRGIEFRERQFIYTVGIATVYTFKMHMVIAMLMAVVVVVA